MNTSNWLIRAITNLHAGSGDADFGIVDKHVQRDPVTYLPTINASSIKGAFREGAGQYLNKEIINHIFGSENPNTGNKRKNNDNVIQGAYVFFSAKLLALPVRSSHHFYYVATCVELLEDFLQDYATFNGGLQNGLESAIEELIKKGKPEQGKPHVYGGGNTKVRLEDWNDVVIQSVPSGLEAILGERVAILNANDFKQLSDELPIIARNHLENGISVNLWYEQVVPREARFYCYIAAPDNDLENILVRQMNSLLQIGGNATIGYGLTRFTKLS